MMTAFLFTGVPSTAAEDDFHCEVLSVEGKVLVTDSDGNERVLLEGDLLSAGDTVEAKEESSADIAFDKDWKNVTHIEEKSKMKIGAVSPGQVMLKTGGVFAKLKQLPKDSSFEVQTPTAVATVRGTEYRTQFTDGQTQVFNVSPSSSTVIVCSVQADGKVNRDQPVVLAPATKTQVPKVGELPKEPVALTPEDTTATETITHKIETHIQTAVTAGRASKIQSVEDIQKALKKPVLKKPDDGSELSRVIDARRRPFKKTGE